MCTVCFVRWKGCCSLLIQDFFSYIYIQNFCICIGIHSTALWQSFGRSRPDNHQLICTVSEEPPVRQQSISSACRTFKRNFSATVTYLSRFICKYQGKEPSKNVFIFKLIFYLNILRSWYLFMYIFAVENQVSLLDLVSTAGHKSSTNCKPFCYIKQHALLGQRERKTI